VVVLPYDPTAAPISSVVSYGVVVENVSVSDLCSSELTTRSSG
jgi:hypothetical protein